jgi:hypothetical protein
VRRRHSGHLTLDDLPLFASDPDLAEAIVGPKHAKEFLQSLPWLERRGFPPRSEMYGGLRYVPLVRKYFELTVEGAVAVTQNGVVRGGQEGTWPKGRSKRRV